MLPRCIRCIHPRYIILKCAYRLIRDRSDANLCASGLLDTLCGFCVALIAAGIDLQCGAQNMSVLIRVIDFEHQSRFEQCVKS